MTQDNNANKPKREETPYDGKKAYVINKNHPHHGATCICQGAEYTNVGWGMVFKNNNSEESFFVFNQKDIKWL